MPRYVAFLRGVNVGGRVVPMAELRAEFEALGFASVETFIASGNVIFETRAAADEKLEAKITQRLSARYGYAIPVFVRSLDEVAAIAAKRPYPKAEVAAAKVLVVALLAQAPDRSSANRLLALSTETDRLRLDGREVYWLARDGQGRSEFSNAVLEKALGVAATMRGMNTVVRLLAKHGAGAKGAPSTKRAASATRAASTKRAASAARTVPAKLATRKGSRS